MHQKLYVAVDSLNIRNNPSTSAGKIETAKRGTAVFVPLTEDVYVDDDEEAFSQGPIQEFFLEYINADGYDWYPVKGTGGPDAVGPTKEIDGWVALKPENKEQYYLVESYAEAKSAPTPQGGTSSPSTKKVLDKFRKSVQAGSSGPSPIVAGIVAFLGVSWLLSRKK